MSDSNNRTTQVSAYFDGACEPVNPGGVGTGGWVIDWDEDNTFTGSAVFGQGDGMTNNVAEYSAAIAALQEIAHGGHTGAVMLYGDSKLVVEQFNGRWACNAPALQKLLKRLRDVAAPFTDVQMEWIPRTLNARADALSRAAYQEYRTGGAA